jgi:hypothetical protein
MNGNISRSFNLEILFVAGDLFDEKGISLFTYISFFPDGVLSSENVIGGIAAVDSVQ